MPAIPSIPLIHLEHDDNQILPTLERALTATGFVLVEGHGVPRLLVATMRRQLAAYFARPLVDKMAEHITSAQLSWLYPPRVFFAQHRRAFRLINTKVTSCIMRRQQTTL